MSDRPQTTEEAREAGYEDGSRAAWLSVLAAAIRGLGQAAPDYASLVKERAEAVAALRRVCEDHGDNDWPDELHLGDVIEKHLGRHLDDA